MKKTCPICNKVINMDVPFGEVVIHTKCIPEKIMELFPDMLVPKFINTKPEPEKLKKNSLSKIYTATNGLSGTLEELIEILDKYTLNQFHDFYHSLFDEELKTVIRPYFVKRMKKQMGIE